MKIEVYSKENCSWCDKAKSLLKLRKMEYTEIPFSATVTKQTVEARAGDGVKINTVPQIFIDDKHVGGYLQLVEYLAANV